MQLAAYQQDDARKLATVADDGTVRIEANDKWKSVPNTPKGVASIALGESGLWALTQFGEVLRWNGDLESSEWSKESPVDNVTAICCSNAGILFATFADGTMQQWENGDWSPLQLTAQHAAGRPTRPESSAQNAKRTHRFSFGLRTLMLAIAGVALLLGPLRWYWSFQQRVENQRLAVAVVEAQGATIVYAHELDSNGVRIKNPKEPGPAWLRYMFGEHAVLSPIELNTDKYMYINIEQISHLKTLKRIDLDHYLYCDQETINIIGQLKELEEFKLGISYISTELDLAPLSSLTKLQKLRIILHKDDDDLSFLRRMKKLKEISIFSFKPFDATELAALSNLEKAYLDDPISLAPLGKLKRLRELEVNSETIDLSGVGELESLRTLDLTNTRIVDLSELADLTNLEELKISSSSEDQNNLPAPEMDLSPLKNLSQLRELSIFHRRLTDVKDLQNLKQLKILNLSDEVVELSDLKEMTWLENLLFVANREHDTSNLASLINLKELGFYYEKENLEYDLSPFSKLTKLEFLYMGYVANPQPLAQIPNLKKLVIARTEVDLTQLRADLKSSPVSDK